jgi:DNA (cytosine-5)-methyltransferase 1
MSQGYVVEWRVVNSAAYGYPQRRKRVFIYAEKADTTDFFTHWHEPDGVLATAFPARTIDEIDDVRIPDDPYIITTEWSDYKVSPFKEFGVALNGTAYTAHIDEVYDGERQTLGDVVAKTKTIPVEYWIDDSQLEKWRYLKGSKREKRIAANGHEYWYSEGQMACPDLLTKPSRTILTGEGGRGASRFKHLIEQDGRYRRLVPEELEELQGFPRGWTDTNMSEGRRAFCMGNALVVGVVETIGRAIQQRRKRLLDSDT